MARWVCVIALALALASCGDVGVSVAPSPAPPPLGAVELTLRVFEQVGRPWYCDSDFYPISRADERELARQRLPEMQQDTDAWTAILAHEKLPPAPATWTDPQLLAVYRDWKDLRALPLTQVSAGVYGASYLVRPRDAAAQQGDRVELRITDHGQVTILSKQAAGRPNCPICLADTTRIATPKGPVRVTDLRSGDLVWTLDERGEPVAAPLIAAGSMDAPPGHEVIRLSLADGRSVAASPGHPTADGTAIAQIRVGDGLDGSRVTSLERLPYRGRTYDVLPAGATGTYWADGVLLGSTLRARTP